MNFLLCRLKKITCRPLITGTFILTLTGLVSRLIGFFYRIYLSRLYGEENMGIYQLISPVIALSFSLTAAGYQTAVSKLTAELATKHSDIRHPLTKKPFWAALTISLPLSLLCTFLTYVMAEPIGIYLLKDERTIRLLQIIAFSFPFVGIHACINGWFYGMKKAGLPSLAQIIEQLTRVGCVFLMTSGDLARDVVPSISTAVFGLALGELVSMTVAILTFFPYFSPQASSGKTSGNSRHLISFAIRQNTTPARGKTLSQTAMSLQNAISPIPSSPSPLPCNFSWREIYGGLLSMALPLTANRLTLTFLGSAESVAIPAMLRAYGYTTEGSLAVYGVLTGMALPLIFFPNALTGSIAVMLLPMISENYCQQKMNAVRSLTFRTLKYCLLMGFACLTGFVLLGPWLGEVMFHSVLAGRCIRTLGWICPFLYLDVTLSSILQGLGKAGTIFGINVLSLLVRLAFVYLAIPLVGIRGYLWGMLAGQLLLSILYGICLYRFFQQPCKHL